MRWDAALKCSASWHLWTLRLALLCLSRACMVGTRKLRVIDTDPRFLDVIPCALLSETPRHFRHNLRITWRLVWRPHRGIPARFALAKFDAETVL